MWMSGGFCLSVISNFQCEQSQALHTLFTQLMLERGFLVAGAFYATFAHQEKHIESYLSAIQGVFSSLAEALNRGNVMDLLKGPVAHTGFYRLT